MSAQLPDELHRLKGTRPTRTQNPAESKFTGGRPTMPKDLSEAAQAEWKRLVRQLHRRGTLTKIDGSALQIYVEMYSRWKLCLQEIEENGIMVEQTTTDSNGQPHTRRVQNPAAKLATQLENSMRQMLREFAATPATREKAKPTQPAAKKEEYEPGTLGWWEQQQKEKVQNGTGDISSGTVRMDQQAFERVCTDFESGEIEEPESTSL